jgi:hypothetical protein
MPTALCLLLWQWLFLSWPALSSSSSSSSSEQLTALTEPILEMSYQAVRLSALAYENSTVYRDGNGSFAHSDYESIQFYTVEPNQAILAQKDGRCYVAFRGTTLPFPDWQHDLNWNESIVYKDNNDTLGEFCETHQAYSEFLRTDTVLSSLSDLVQCVATCPNPDECVVLAGHSQGGADAAILSILIHYLKPMVFTYGMPPAIDKGCTLVPSDRFYRYVNYEEGEGENDDQGFDAIPYSKPFVGNSVHYGQYILVGPDPDAAKYLGTDTNYTFRPSLVDRASISAHTLSGEPFSYVARITALRNATSFPVSLQGFDIGVHCKPSYPELCASGSCRGYQCSEKATELCVLASCTVDSDCASGSCVWGACATSDRLVENGCPCRSSANCVSGECQRSSSSLERHCINATSSAAPIVLLSWLVSVTVGALATL